MGRVLRGFAVILFIALALGAGGGALLRMANSAEARELAQQTWPVTDGTLFQLTISPPGTFRRGSYINFARFVYRVGDREFKGTSTNVPSAGGYDVIKNKLSPLLIRSGPALQERDALTGRELVYTPLGGQPVRVSYNPTDPADAVIFLTPPRSGFMTGAKVIGWVLVAGGSFFGLLSFVVLVSDGRAALARESERARRRVPAPDDAELAGFTRLLDRVIEAVATAAQQTAAAKAWEFYGSSLIELQKNPARALIELPRLGYSRTIGECGLDDGGPAARRVSEAVNALESFHAAFRRKHRPEGED
jgi:Protein of unknown function (DUF3592)